MFVGQVRRGQRGKEKNFPPFIFFSTYILYVNEKGKYKELRICVFVFISCVRNAFTFFTFFQEVY